MPVSRHTRRLMCVLVLLAGTSCAAPAKRGDDDSTVARAPVDDRTVLAKLEREARALARTDGCASTETCRTAPLGWRGCGGPRTYVVYCAATTDSVALYRKLDELREAESAYNAKSGMMSTCEMRVPPIVTARAGRCIE